MMTLTKLPVLLWTIGTLLGTSHLVQTESDCVKHNTSLIPRCHFDIDTDAIKSDKTIQNSVKFRPKKHELCLTEVMSFGPETLIEVTTSGGNLSDSGQVFAERIRTDGCTKDVVSLMTVENFDGCQRNILQNTSINLYLQTSVSIQLQAVSQRAKRENASLCTDSVKVYGSFTQCRWVEYETGENEVIRCNFECLAGCSCTLGDREVVSSCGGDGSRDKKTLIVYPIPAKILHLAHMGLTSLSSEAFRSLRGKEAIVKKLMLHHNKLTALPDGLFYGLRDMYSLNLSFNAISKLQPNVFEGLTNLVQLFMESNNISSLPDGVFNGLDNLEKLWLTNNQITHLQANVFLPMVNLVIIRLRNNIIQHISPGAMTGMQNVKNIDMSFNQIRSLDKGALSGLREITDLTLHNNNIERIDPGVFLDTPNLINLWIYGVDNTLIYVSHSSFKGLTNNSLVIVAKAATCCFVREAQCENKSPESAFLTCERLLPNGVLRVLMWILGLCAFLGNIAVLYWRYSRKVRENPVQSFLITNLSISDLLMGVYMLIIASSDVYFGNNFPPQADTWRNGFTCKFAGFVAMVSSEASVFFVTLISIDRLFRIKYTFSKFTMQERSSYVISSALWIIAISIGIVAIILSVKKPDLYQMSEVCIGLPLTRKNIHEPYKVQIGNRKRKVQKFIRSEPAMFFSMAIFLGLNLFCFLIVAICYLQIFITVKRSSKKAGGKSDKEVKLAIKMAVIIWTDFCCWVPIAILGILVQSGAVDISPVVYAWIVTFILPINSSVNPFLYTIATLTTERLRQRLSSIGETLTGMGLLRTSS
ncbi:uncharacterized protein [Amphiura filiformis]|uniref:uncharacterized protein n=1 Tax=Amphiura filiformis TaxID=82378 RepID=UPI003B21E088